MSKSIPSMLSPSSCTVSGLIFRSLLHLKFIFLYGDSVCAQAPSCVWLFATPWTVACQAPLSVQLSWQECWSVISSSRDLPYSGMEPASPVASYMAGEFFITEPPGKSHMVLENVLNFILLCVAIQFSQHQLLKRLVFYPLCILPSFVIK